MLYIPACLNPLPRLSSSGFAGRGLTKSLVTNDGYPPKSRGPALSHRPLRLPGGVLPSKRLLGMCRWIGSHFHNWTDYNGVTFSGVTIMGSQIFGILGIRKFW